MIYLITDEFIPSHDNLDIYNSWYNKKYREDILKITERLYDYNGAVDCISVPNEIFYVRRNGKAVWTGNSRPRGPRTLLTRQPPEGYTIVAQIYS